MTEQVGDWGRFGQLRLAGAGQAGPEHGPAVRSTSAEAVQAELHAAVSRISLAHLRLHGVIGVLPRELREVAIESMGELDAVASSLRRLLSDLDYAADDTEY